VNKSETHSRFCLALVSGLLVLCLMGSSAEAAEAAAWRPLYDLIMRWINFGILIFFIVKYGRGPLMNFLKGQQAEVAKEIDQVESKKNALLEQIRQTQKKIHESSQRFEEIKKQTLMDGEREKQKIIDDARELSKNMLEAEKKKAHTRIISARNRFMAELVDAAMVFAQQKLPDEMTDTDHQKMLHSYLSSLSKISE